PGQMPVEISDGSPSARPVLVLDLDRSPSTVQWRREPESVPRWPFQLPDARPDVPELEGNPTPILREAGRSGAHPAVEMRIHHRNSPDSNGKPRPACGY